MIVNAQAGTWARPRLVKTARVAGRAAVTDSGVVMQDGHCLLPVSLPKACAALSTGTFIVEPSGQVTTPAGALDGGGPVKTRLPLMKASLSASDGKPLLGPELSSPAVSTTRPDCHCLASGDRAQAVASRPARASKAVTFTPAGGLVVGDVEAGDAEAGEAGAPDGDPPEERLAAGTSDGALEAAAQPASRPATAHATRETST